jgi:hypothetical protein
MGCFFISSALDMVFLLDNKSAGPSKALPRCALPKYLTEELQKHIPNAIFASNPCRLETKLMPKPCNCTGIALK